MSPKKLGHFYFYCNFGKCWLAFKMWLFKAAPAHCARETVEVLCRETPDFISPDLWPPNRPDLNPVDYEIWAVMQHRVYQRKIHTIDELKQRLIEVWCGLEQSTWLLTSGAKDLELVFVRREDTSTIVFELNNCLDFVNFLSPSLSCFAWILHRWVQQHCCNGSHSH